MGIRRRMSSIALAAGLGIGGAAPAASGETPLGATRKAEIEADWLRQAAVRGRAGAGAPVTTREDAAGACDGVKDGRWGFHTEAEDGPWWQVDLGAVHRLSRVVLYNRCDGGVAARASHFILSLSGDGRAWCEAYRHHGTVFYGATDGKPLAVPLRGAEARFVRIALPGHAYLHLDEVEVYGVEAPERNLALGRPADQSSVSRWSTRAPRAAMRFPVEDVIARGRRLAEDLRGRGVDVEPSLRALAAVAGRARDAKDPEDRRALYLEARWIVRRLALANPLLDFDALLFAKRVPGRYSHMSDQYYGWWSRPGGGVYVLEGLEEDAPRARCLTSSMPPGSFLRPDLSHDARRVLFAYCRHHPHVAEMRDKVDKARIPEDAFYDIFEMGVDGTGLRQLTRGRYDDFDARYLPSGEIVFLSTRRGQFVQCGAASAAATLRGTEPDGYVRCGGGAYRPVAIYTLHVMDAHGRNLRTISPFENFEWTPSIAGDGRILFARWDYVDRTNMPFMSLWSTNPDGTGLRIVYGNFTRQPHCIFEARAVPGSRKILFTASGHHSITGGSLVLLDPDRGVEGPAPIVRLTPEVCFPESEGWPPCYYANPYALSEKYFLVAWSAVPLTREGRPNPPNSLGLYLYDAFGNLELIYRDPEISCMYPIPLRSRATPRLVPDTVAWGGPSEGRILLGDVYMGLKGIARGTIRRLRIVGVPPKTQPEMNHPVLGVTRDDPGKFVIGTVPVERDGSAHFRAPAGIPIFFQALDGDGMAVQTMRTVTYVQPGQRLSCAGCHEPRSAAPRNVPPLAAARPPSRITPGPEGSWPLRFDRLVGPVLERHCVRCHRPGAPDPEAARFDLTPAKAYGHLIGYGRPSLRDHVLARYQEGRSVPGACAARRSALLALLGAGHHDVRLDADAWDRLITWMDTYGQRLGSFSPDQEARLRRLRERMADLLAPPPGEGGARAETGAEMDPPGI